MGLGDNSLGKGLAAQEDLVLSPSPMDKRLGMVVRACNVQGHGGRGIPGTHWPTSKMLHAEIARKSVPEE